MCAEITAEKPGGASNTRRTQRRAGFPDYGAEWSQGTHELSSVDEPPLEADLVIATARVAVQAARQNCRPGFADLPEASRESCQSNLEGSRVI